MWFVKLDYDGSAGLAPLDPSEARQVSEARDDELVDIWLSASVKLSRNRSICHTPLTRGAHLLSRSATFPPFCGGIASNRERLKVRGRHARGRRLYDENTDNQLIDILLVFELKKTVALRRQSFSSVRTEISCFCVLCGRAEWL